MNMKQVIVVRSDLKLPKGKMSAQVAHAAVESALKADKTDVSSWRRSGQMKVVVKVDSVKQLMNLKADMEHEGIPHSLITDAGRTVIAPGTITCLGIGPVDEDRIDPFTDKLKLM